MNIKPHRISHIAYRIGIAALCTGVVCCLPAIGANAVRVDDAFVRSNRDGSRWVVGTDAVELTYALNGGRFQLAGCVNKLTKSARDYVGAGAAVDLLPCENSVFPDNYRVERAWSKVLFGGVVADPSADDQITRRRNRGSGVGANRKAIRRLAGGNRCRLRSRISIKAG